MSKNLTKLRQLQVLLINLKINKASKANSDVNSGNTHIENDNGNAKQFKPKRKSEDNPRNSNYDKSTGDIKKLTMKKNRSDSENKQAQETKDKDKDLHILTVKDKSHSDISSMKPNFIINNKEYRCTICNKPQSDKVTHIKCYYDDCANFFCNDCYQRNFFQARASNYKCTYLNCDTCHMKRICIMSSLFCNSCDKRVCSKCYKQNHSDHGNVKYYS